MSDASTRTIPATPRRREAARREGLVPSAAPLAWAATATTTVLLLPAWGRATVPAATEMVREAIGAATGLHHAGWTDSVWAVVLPSLGLAMAGATAGLAVRVLCDGLSWQPGRLAFTFRRIDPLAGFGRMFSSRTALGLVGQAASLALLAVACVLGSGSLAAAVAGGLGDAVTAGWRVLAWLAAATVVVTICHYAVARMSFERRIRMTPQEFAEEAKALQSDPKIRLLHQAALNTRSARGTAASAH